MITNATLLTITPPPTGDADGGAVEGSPVDSGAAVFMDGLKHEHQVVAAANKLQDCSAMVYVKLADATAIADDSRISIQFPAETPVKLRVLRREDLRLGGLSHAALYCRRL